MSKHKISNSATQQTFINYGFVHEISCKQNCFRWTSVHVGIGVRKRADVNVTNNVLN